MPKRRGPNGIKIIILVGCYSKIRPLGCALISVYNSFEYSEQSSVIASSSFDHMIDILDKFVVEQRNTIYWHSIESAVALPIASHFVLVPQRNSNTCGMYACYVAN